MNHELQSDIVSDMVPSAPDGGPCSDRETPSEETSRRQGPPRRLSL